MLQEALLCPRCRSIQIPSLFHGPRYETEEDLIDSEELDVRVGSIAQLKEQKHCHLCWLLFRIYEYELTGHFADDGEETECYASRKDPRKICCMLRPTRADLILNYDPCGMVDKIATQLMVEFDPPVPPIFHAWGQDQADAKGDKTNNPYSHADSRSLYRGWSIALDHGSVSSGRALLNRSWKKDEMINIGQLHSLLHTCRSYHPICNEKVETTAQGAKATPIILLDVWKRVMICANSDTRYIALSYVWDNVDGERYPGFEDGFSEGCAVPKLPSIMEDSITIVKQLEERFLWIDQLCIDQKNATIKKMQIKQMNIVYSHAELTLVVLARSSVHGGIPGVRPNTRKVEHHGIRFNGQDFTVGTVWNHFHTIAGSTWNSRGWTFEEGMLSRRCLVFGPKEMFFDCASGIGSETLGLPIYHKSSQTTVSLKHSPKLMDSKFWNRAFPTGWNFSFYAQSVTFYSYRDLSHARDSLNAFLGILSRLTFTTNMRFVQGLPRDELLKGMLWFPLHPSVPSSSSRLSGFPSWTWAGWTGPKHYCVGYQEAIDQIQEDGRSSSGSGSYPRLASVTIFDDGNDHTRLKVSSHVRHFSLLSVSGTNPLYMLKASNGKLILDVLGSHEPHDQPGPKAHGGLLDLNAHPASASSLTYFLYLAYWKDAPKKRDHVLAMLIREINGGVFERAALCGIPVQEWNAAPIVEGLNHIVLV